MSNEHFRLNTIDHSANIDSTRLDACHQFMPITIEKQIAVLDRVSQDPCANLYESLIRQIHIDSSPINPVKFFEQACEIAAHAEAASLQPVLYSTSIRNRDRAEDYVNANNDADLIYTTPVGWFLDRLELFNPDLSPLNPEFGHLLGFIGSIRFIRETAGDEVIAFTDGAKPESTFRLIEINELEHNHLVRTINQDPKSQIYSQSTVSILEDWITAVQNAQDAKEFSLHGNSLSAKFNMKSSEFRVISEADQMAMRRHVVNSYLAPMLKKISP